MRRVEIASQVRMRNSDIAVVAAIVMAIMNSSCYFDTKSALCEKSGLLCPPGWSCSADQMACIQGGCGDGIRFGQEECDDGGTESGDGCSADCRLEICGNGIVDPHEECDGQENCSADCHLRACGNGFVDTNEDCDAAGVDSPGCNKDCTFATCGDGKVNFAAGEQCDSMNEITAECNGPLCTPPVCGDSFFNPAAGEECDTGEVDTKACNGNANANGVGNCKMPRCGDLYTNKQFVLPGTNQHEECDTGGMDDSSCDFDCTKPMCGDGHRNIAAGEGCDDGNKMNDDDCPDGLGGTCKDAFCGDGFRKTQGSNTEACDTSGVDTMGCDGMDCTLPRCGDGYVNMAAGEMCDPGDSNHPQAGCPGAGGTGNTCAGSGANACKVCL